MGGPFSYLIQFEPFQSTFQTSDFYQKQANAKTEGQGYMVSLVKGTCYGLG